VSLQEWIFAAVALVGTAAALRLVTSQNVVHAALYLVLSLAAVAGTYVLLAAEFVAWVQVLIYIGSVVVLLLFGLMLTRAPIGREALDNQQRFIAAVVALAVTAGLGILLWEGFGATEFELTRGTTAMVGESLFTRFVLPFEVVSFLLLAALIGAIVLARKEDPR
jgi:NADH-quinone oxidoreductase subunit J